MNRSNIHTSYDQQDGLQVFAQPDIRGFEKNTQQESTRMSRREDDAKERRKRLDRMRLSHYSTVSPAKHADLDSEDEGSLDGSVSSWMDTTGRKLFGASSKKNKKSIGSMDSLNASSSSLGRMFSFGTSSGPSKNNSCAAQTAKDGSESSLEDGLFAEDTKANKSSSGSSGSSFLGKFVVQRKSIKPKNTSSQEEVDKSELVKRREAAQEMLKGNVTATDLPKGETSRSLCQNHQHSHRRRRSRRQSVRSTKEARQGRASARRRSSSVAPSQEGELPLEQPPRDRRRGSLAAKREEPARRHRQGGGSKLVEHRSTKPRQSERAGRRRSSMADSPSTPAQRSTGKHLLQSKEIENR